MDRTPQPVPSLLSVNLLYLATILATLTFGATLQAWNLTWGVIASEVLIYLLPGVALIAGRRGRGVCRGLLASFKISPR